MISFLAINHDSFFSQATQLKNQISEATGVNVEISSMKGNQIKHQYDFSPHFYDIDDYDRAPGMEQYFNQKSLGHQVIFQLSTGSDDLKSSIDILDAFRTQILSTGYGLLDTQIFDDDIGDGAVVYYYMDEGQVIVTWNGDARIDVNIFTYAYESHFEEANLFLDKKFLDGQNFSLMLLDEQPRGIGRVVNPRSETNTYKGSIACHDDYYFCPQYAAKEGDCESNQFKDFLNDRCKASCGNCREQ